MCALQKDDGYSDWVIEECDAEVCPSPFTGHRIPSGVLHCVMASLVGGASNVIAGGHPTPATCKRGGVNDTTRDQFHRIWQN